MQCQGYYFTEFYDNQFYPIPRAGSSVKCEAEAEGTAVSAYATARGSTTNARQETHLCTSCAQKQMQGTRFKTYAEREAASLEAVT